MEENNPIPIHPNVAETYLQHYKIVISNKANYPTEEKLALNPTRNLPCGFCANNDAKMVYDEVDGCNAGGSYYYGFHCKEWNHYTKYEREFG